MRQQSQTAPSPFPPRTSGPFDNGAFIDLSVEIAQLWADASIKEEAGRKSKMLARYPEFRTVLITMKDRSTWGDHKTSSRISVQVLRGHIRFHTPNSTFELYAGQPLALDPGILHSVDSPEESAFLLTLSSAANR
jgi:quercetin dioxygenase-like cupin family protein